MLSGDPCLVFVEGEAGRGKSRLLSEAIERSRPETSVILRAHGVDLMGDQLPYGLVAEVVRSCRRERSRAPQEHLPASVSVHVSHVLAKLHAASRTEAMAVAFRSGIVHDER